MRAPCWLVGHRRELRSEFIRRSDGYPLGIYTPCKHCNKRLQLVWNRSEPAPFDEELAARWAREFE